MIYEMRVYRCLPGRLPALLKRFETTTLKLWEKHGIRPAGFFTTLVGESNQELTYLLAWESLRRPREEMGGIPERSRLDRCTRENRGGRPDRRQHRQPAAGADRLLVGEVTGHSKAKCPTVSTISCTPSTISTWRRRFYRRAGFTVGARNRHPWGTHNRIVQLKNCYIEILEVGEPERIVPHGARSFSFGAFKRDFLAQREGFSMLILNSSNAASDARAFEISPEYGNSEVFDFAREGTKPDGHAGEAGVLAGFRVGSGLAESALRGVPASLSREFLGPGVSGPRQRRRRRARRCHGRRQPDGPSHLPESVYRAE